MPYLFSYSTTILLIDDNENFLSAIRTSLSNQHSCITESNPIKALEIVKKNQAEHNIYFKNQCTVNDPDDILAENNQLSQIIPTQEFINLSQSLNRHQKITTIILDHDMPEMDGFSFARNLCKQDISVIMLTGIASHELAVEAFNQGIIDKFLLKDSPSLKLILSQHIEDAKHTFFYKQTHKLAYNTNLYQTLFSAEFSELFSKIIAEYKIIEYYLFNSNGSYLLITEKNERLIFSFMSELELNYYREVAKGNTSEKILTDTLESGYIPCFYSNEMDLTIADWKNYLYLADTLRIEGNNYYYAIRKLDTYQ